MSELFNASLLLVEDDDTLSKVTEKALSRRGFSVACASDLAGAQECVAQQQFDFAVLDLKLAESTSLSLIPVLKAQHPKIKILMLTAYASIATAVEAVKLGADNYLPKPANVSEILQALGLEEAEEEESDEGVMSPRRLEWEHIQRVLQKNDGNISATARELNMHRRTLQRKLQKKPVKD